MANELQILIVTAGSIGFFHTLLGPDHYVPFIVMAKARQWSLMRTILVTFACGIGHVGSSLVIGIIGIAMGISINHLVEFESARGEIAAWTLIIFGVAYMTLGIRKMTRKKPYSNVTIHGDSNKHLQIHNHTSDHIHRNERKSYRELTPWLLFTIFVLGPCEPLIPVLLYPAAKHNTNHVILVSVVFASVTVITMVLAVILSLYGAQVVPAERLKKYIHPLAGASILLCGVGIRFFGL
jgi:nickel/cobalt transporter (NicO) family protein